MLDIKWIRDNPEALGEALKKRNWTDEARDAAVSQLIALDEARRAHLGTLQTKQERRNTASKEIGNAMRSGDSVLAEKLKAEVGEIKEFLAGAEDLERKLDKELEAALAVLPNIPLDDVPPGKDEHDNVLARTFGTVKPRPNWAREHFEIGEAMGLMDFERATRMSGSRFTILKGQLARLERALGQFMLDLHTTEHGYTEVQPPLMVRDEAMFGTGQLPKFWTDLYETYSGEVFGEKLRENFSNVWMAALDAAQAGGIEKAREAAQTLEGVDQAGSSPDRLWLIPTAEVPLTNLVREEILDAKTLPLRFTALTPCFRSEAGSAGRDTRGMLRQHQFYKVELVSITDQENSLAEHERMTACAEEVLKRLDLPFRTITLCAGDMGFGARKTYDIEVWLPGQNAYREISSCSVCGDFQARRMDARYKVQGEKATRFVHTLNGSGVAVGRALIAVMENYQNQDGSVTIPQVLRPYMGGLEKIG
jgi:seryl-tRNA synthetase